MQYEVKRVTIRGSKDGIYIGDKSVFRDVYARRFEHDRVRGVAKYAEYLERSMPSNRALLEAMVRLHWHGLLYGEIILRCSCKVDAPCHGDAIKTYLETQQAALNQWHAHYRQQWSYRTQPNPLNSTYHWNFNEYQNAPIVLEPGLVYVYGSNLNGIHGKGAALEALQWYGAKLGVGEGHVGRCYGIPTKDRSMATRPLEQIADSIDTFLQWQARTGHPCYLTPVGCGLAGHLTHEIAPLFSGLRNSWVPNDWYVYLL
jgi:hypothetical protein